MKQRHSSPKLTALERQLIERLRQHPPRLARVQSIVDLADATDGPLQSADAVEALLIWSLRQLGSTTMNQWATQAEGRVGAELQRQDASVRRRKKKRWRGGVFLAWWRWSAGLGAARAISGLCPDAWA